MVSFTRAELQLSEITYSLWARTLVSNHGPENNPKPNQPSQNPTEFLEVFCTYERKHMYSGVRAFYLIELTIES